MLWPHGTEGADVGGGAGALALEKGWQLRAWLWQDGFSTDDLLAALATHLAVQVRLVPALPFGLPGAILDRLVVLDQHLPAPERRWVLAHELGHAALHVGNILVLSDSVWLRRQDRQADLFAGAYLLGEPPVAAEPRALAWETGLPVDRVHWWLSQLHTMRKGGVLR